MKTLKLTIGLIITLILNVVGLTSQQQEPLPPKNFTATVEQTNAGQVIKLTWTANEEGVTPNIYMIYSTVGDHEKLMTLGKVIHDANKVEYEYILYNLAPGVYNIFMTAALYMNGIIIESERTESISIEIKGNNTTLFQFASTPPISAFVGGKYVYAMKVHSSYKCHIGYELLDAPEGMYIEGNTIYWLPTTLGEFNVSVKAFLTECDQNAETTQQFIIRVTEGNNGQFFVKIIGEDYLNMKFGEALVYRFNFETNANCPIIFEFQGQLPDGFQHDKNGTFVFKPSKEGKYGFTVKAYLECHPDVHHVKQFVIVVGEGHNDQPKHCAYIKGMVTDENNLPVMEGIASAWNLDRNSNTKEMTVFRSEIKQGQYSINVPAGNFALDVSGKTFYPEWYMDAKFVTDAERIEIECEEEIEINAVVTMLPVPKTYTVTGKVFDATDNTPVMAQVEFIPVQNVFEDSKNSTDRHSFITKTDDAGNYTIEIPDNQEYIARAVSMMNSVKYPVLYYENAPNPMEADIIELTGNLSEINFGLKKHEEVIAGFSGKVINKEGAALSAKVIAYCVKPYNQYFKEVHTVFTTETDDAGYYKFDNLIPGDYVVMSIPLDKIYVPGYYKVNDFAVIKWKEGTIIAVDEVMIDMIIEIKHRLRGEIGLVQIDGKIINSGGGKIEKQGEKTQSSTPLAGALVYIVDENGMISDYGYTNSFGEFNLKEVAIGNLKLVADKVGFDAYESQIQTDFEKNSNINLEFEMSEAIVNVDDNNDNIFNAVLYPVPSEKYVFLQYTTDGKNPVLISIVNTQGFEVTRLNFETKSEKHTTKLELSNFVSGTYFIRLTVGNQTQTLPLQIVR